MRNEYGVPDKAFTHGGKFHSDDVFAAALLRYMNPDIEIIRGFSVPEEFDGIVFDIGFGEFDHHQSDREVREDEVPYAAFGLLWKKFGPMILGEEEALEYDRKFVKDLDLSDNTGSDNPIAYVISEFNPSWDSNENKDVKFFQAVDMAQGILTRHFESVFGMNRAKDEVEDAMKECDGSILVLKRHAPWKKYVKGSSYIFTVYPSMRGGYCAQCVEEEESKKLKCRFPESWCGKTEAELVEITGISTLTFCHNSGFMISAGTKEDVLTACNLAIKEKEKEV